jgi:hypothetical protein
LNKLILFFFLIAPITAQAQFREVNPDHTSQRFQSLMAKTLLVLKEHPTNIGVETYRSFIAGHVRVDEFADFTFEDFQRFLREFPGLVESGLLGLYDYPHLQDENSRAVSVIEDTLQGYAYGDRLYINIRDQGPTPLASTLVHEVNHILNHSERVYYNSPRDAFIEEYRAYYAEALFAGRDVSDPEFCRRLKIKVLKLVTGTEGLMPDDFPDHPHGKLIPNARNWDD